MELDTKQTFTVSYIKKARAEALLSKRRLMTVLEDQLNLPQLEFLRLVSNLCDYPCMEMSELHALQADALRGV